MSTTDGKSDGKTDEKSADAKRNEKRRAEKRRVETEFGGGKHSCEHPLMGTLRKELKAFRLTSREENRALSTPLIFAAPDEEWPAAELVSVFRTFWRSQPMRGMLRSWMNYALPDD